MNRGGNARRFRSPEAIQRYGERRGEFAAKRSGLFYISVQEIRKMFGVNEPRRKRLPFSLSRSRTQDERRGEFAAKRSGLLYIS